MKMIEVELLVEDAEEEVGPRVQARACARTDALGVGAQQQHHGVVDEHVVDRLSHRHVVRSRRCAWRRRGLEATQTSGSTSTASSWVRAARRHVCEIRESLITRSADHQDAIH